MTSAADLLKLCDYAVKNPEWQPKGEKTFCNIAADYIATGMGCWDLKDFNGQPLMADDIYNMIIGKGKIEERWRPVTLGGTWVLANQGALVFGILNSTQLGESHGHLSTVVPGDPIWSGHWENMSPLCANVGKENFIGRPMSYAFRTQPDFFAWIPSIPKETKEVA